MTTDNVTSIEQNQNLLSLNLPRFTNGDGSVIRIDIQRNSSQPLFDKNYNAYATHEKGSSKNYPSNPQCPNLFTSFLLLPYSPLIILGIVLIIAYIPLLVYLNIRKDRKIFIDLPRTYAPHFSWYMNSSKINGKGFTGV